MDRLESNEGFLFARLNCRADSSTPSATKPRYAVRRVTPSAGLCLLALAWPAVARAANISVCASGCDQVTVAAAVAAAANGDTITIGAGTYPANIMIPAGFTLHLEGAGAEATILDGRDRGPVLIVDAGGYASVQSVTVERGGGPPQLPQAGIVVYGNLRVSDSLITQNSIGIANYGGAVSVLRSTIRDNHSSENGFGAGFTNVAGSADLFYSTISGNDGTDVGGVSIQGGNVSLLNTTVSGNTGNPVANIYGPAGGTLEMLNSTVVNSAPGTVSISLNQTEWSVSNSILSSAPGETNCNNDTGAVLSSHNLSSDYSCHLATPTNLANNQSINLGPLQANAPGTNATHALLPGSAAIDAGDCSSGTTVDDERGVSRPQGPACDIGAYELRAPVAIKDNYTVVLGKTLVLPPPGILGNDFSPDGLPLFVIGESLPAHGALTLLAQGALIYTPQPGFTGEDVATYELWDGVHTSSTVATVTFHDNANNTPPITQPDNYSVLEGQVLTVNALQGVLANDQDPNYDLLTVLVRAQPAHGFLKLSVDGSFIYTSNAGFYGTDSFTYTASDGYATSASTLVTITVMPNFGTITIALSTQPESTAAFSFTSTLGNFTLGGSSPSSKTFEASAGTWSFTELLPQPWLLTNIVCKAGTGVFVDLTVNNLQLVLSDGASMTCTFVDQLPGQISARAYFDLNADSQRESGEPWLRGWTMQVFLNPTVPVGSGVTGSNGTVTFPNLEANIYTVCEVPPAGWQSTNPPVINPAYGKPCFTVNLGPGQSLPVLFGNAK
jgi:hypothetical protein